MVKFLDQLLGLTGRKPEKVETPPKPAEKRVESVPATVKRPRKKPGRKARAKPVEKAEKKPTKRGSNPRDEQGHFLPKTEDVPPLFSMLNARFFTTPEGQVMTDVDFNLAFVAEVDKKFADQPGWDRTLPGNAKVALFLYSVMTEMVEPFLVNLDSAEVPQEVEDPMAEIPVMAIHGGKENVQRVDISRMKRVGQL